ncbi:MAG: hypothetical protein ACJ79A_15640 [Gemmatimonadaceae bacterium]
MDQGTMIAIVVAVLVLAVIGWLVWRRQQSDRLKARYGPEYARAVNELGDKRRAESELVKRQERVAAFDIRPLSAEQQNGYLQQWRAVQTRFVDDPKGAVTDADRLVEDVMRTRGYPVSDFDQRAADLSVHHPRVVENYRAARDIAQRHRRGEATTEDLRQAMVYYRGLFQDLLEDREHAEEEKRDAAAPRANDERVVERSATRDDDGRMEIPVRRVGEQRSSDQDIRNDREVRP